MSPGSNTKGAAFRAFIEWIDREYGSDRSRRVHRDLPPELAQRVDPDEPGWGILVSSWYPDELLNRLLAGYLDPLDRLARLEVLEKATEYARDQTYKGIYRHAIRLVVSPETCARYVNRLWHLHYDTGTVTWRYRPGRVESDLVGWKGHHPYRCEINRLSEQLTLEMLGCKGVRSTLVKCVDRGDASCGCVSVWADPKR